MPLRRFPMWQLALLIILIAIVNDVAMYWHIYYYVWWLDIPMHLIGGLWVGLMVAAIMARYGFLSRYRMNTPQFFLCVVLAVFIVGACWELFEFSVDNFVRIHFAFGGLADTIKDLIDDVLGGIVGVYFFIRGGYHKMKI